jgi:hypothetical protein
VGVVGAALAPWLGTAVKTEIGTIIAPHVLLAICAPTIRFSSRFL